MAASYPGAVKTFTNKTNKVDLYDAADVNNVQAEISAIETELGIGLKGSRSDLVARMAIMIGADGALSKGTAFPTSPTPVAGQPFYRTDQKTLYAYDGSAWISVGVNMSQLFSATGTWVCPAGVNMVMVSMVGGGGGGGGGDTNNEQSGGGGGGGAARIRVGIPVTPGNSYTCTVGAGGAGGTYGTDGGAGGASSFTGDQSASIDANGGTGGRIWTNGTGGNGGTATGTASLDASGVNRGGLGLSTVGGKGGTASSGTGGAGGNSMYGYGGAGAYHSSNNGYGYGGGGSGAGRYANGGVGASGMVYLEW